MMKKSKALVGASAALVCAVLVSPLLTAALIEVVGEVLGDEAIEKCAEYVLLEVPTIDASAEVVGNLPDRLVELCSLYVGHLSKLHFLT